MSVNVSKNLVLAKKLAAKRANQKATRLREFTQRYCYEKAKDFEDPQPFRIESFQNENTFSLCRSPMRIQEMQDQRLSVISDTLESSCGLLNPSKALYRDFDETYVSVIKLNNAEATQHSTLG